MKEIKLSGRGDLKGRVALVSDEDYEVINKHKWHCRKSGTKNPRYYAARNIEVRDVDGKKKSWTFYMHWVVLEKKKGFDVDHINGNSLDNTRSNLQYLTHQNNIKKHFLQNLPKNDLRRLQYDLKIMQTEVTSEEYKSG